MWLRSLLDSWKPRPARALARWKQRDGARRRPATVRLRLESLEDRCLLSNYVVSDLGSFVPSAINNLGQMAGSALSQAALWRNGTTIGLGSLGREIYATAINDVGQVTGLYVIPDPNNPWSGLRRGFLVTPEDTNLDGVPDLWYRDTNLDGVNDLMVNIGPVDGLLTVTGINNAGIVVGEWQAANSLGSAWIWQNGETTDLGVGPYAGRPDINDAGQVAGLSNGSTFLINPEDTNDDGIPDLWNRDTNGDGVNDLMLLLPNPGDNPSDVKINAGGQVVSGNFLWTPDIPNGTTFTLTVLNPNDRPRDYWVTTNPSDINDSGQVVGVVSESWATDDEGGGGGWSYHFLWENGELVDLNSLISPTGNWWSDSAINNQGWIVGQGQGTDGIWGGVLLTPSDQAPPPIPPFITIGDVTITEGNNGTRAANFTVTFSKSWTETVTVSFTTMNGSAASGSDYQAASGTLTFAPGETSKPITVQVNGDRLGEVNETFFVTLGNPINGIIARGQGVGTIVDDEPRISINDVTKAEGNNRQRTLFTFTVTLAAAYDQPVTMSFRTVDGTATSGSGDYIAKTGTLTFAPGETTKTITIEVKGDNRKETNETFYLDLFGNSSNSLFTNSRGIGTILNDD